MARMWMWLKSIHEGMNHISNVEVHLKTRSGNVNIEHTLHLPTQLQKRTTHALIIFYLPHK